MSKKNKPSKTDPEKSQIKPSGKNILSWVVFIPTLVVVLLSLLPAVFPALLTRFTSPFQGVITSPEFVSPFQPSILAVPLIIVNLVLLGIGLVYYKKKADKCRNIINRISSFEISKKQALVAVIILIAIFAGITGGTLAKEETWVDYKGVKETVQSWHPSRLGISAEPHIRYLLLQTSLNVFGNIRLIPFIASGSLLLLTYFFTKNITQKRFAGIVSMALLLQSDIFVSYSTAASYDNFWILLYLFGLFLIQKFWPPSPVSFLLTIFSKALTVAFLPMTFYFIARSSLPKRSKVISLISYGIIAIALLVGASVLKSNMIGSNTSSDISQFWQGFSAIAMQMRFDYVVILFLLPVTVMLFFASWKGILHADSMIIFILSILLIAPFLSTFTDQTNQPYRFVSLSVFFAIGVGVLLSKRTRKQDELLSNTQ